MIFGILTLITALSISAVAIYYSVGGLVAIFAAAAIPIMIMGGTLEIAKLVTAVWLHRYWSQATWWLRTYLALAVVVLMLITSMGIFGFLSKAHIEQTSAGEESVAQVERLTTEIARQTDVVKRAEEKINVLQTSGNGSDANIQSQIDKEQERIDLAFKRIEPAIAQQNTTIESARTNDATRTKPYEDQLTNIQAEVLRLETSAKEYEQTITTLEADSGAIQPLLDSITDIEEEIIRVTNQLQSSERDQIRAGQAIIGVSSDGAFGGNTRKALVAWVGAQRARITQVQLDVSQLRQDATAQVDAERTRLADVIKDIRTVQIPALKDREVIMLAKIDEVRQTESPTIATARDEIQRLRESAESQVSNSQTLIERLRGQLAQTDKADEIDAAVDEQTARIKTANASIDALTEEKYALEIEYRKLEAEVGPIKYIAEFVYGEQADKNMLEKAVTWVIVIIIFVFDPLAVLLLIAAQYTFDFRRKELEDDNGARLRLEREEYERARAQRINDNPSFNIIAPAPPAADEKEEINDRTRPRRAIEEVVRDTSVRSRPAGGDTSGGMAMAREGELNDNDTSNETVDTTEYESVGTILPEEPIAQADATDNGLEQDQVQSDGPAKAVGNIPNTINRMFYPEELESKKNLNSQLETNYYEDREKDDVWVTARAVWEKKNPEQDRAAWKNAFAKGEIDSLPWEQAEVSDNYNASEGYQQNAEQSENTLFNKLSKK